MSSINHYQDLLKYLEESQNEIARAFENPNDDENIDANKEEKEEAKEGEDDINFLIKLNEKIESDLIELIAKSEVREISEGNQNASNGIHAIEANTFGGSELCLSKFHLNDHGIAIDAATQTSPPSLSPSSTNLTWASNSSSSPCLLSPSTSPSDSDCLEDFGETGAVSVPNGQEKKAALGSKFSSTPVLKTNQNKVNKQSRSQSDRHLTEIEAAEACKWLRATGFPQYAQLYEDNLFPIELSTVSQDHPLLESNILHSLFRRLQILNSCAHLHQQKIVNTDESEDECCALSDNWTYQNDIKRWSRNSYRVPHHSCENSSKDAAVPNRVQNKSLELKKTGIVKYRQRREGVVLSEKTNILDQLSQLHNLKISEFRHSSDSEATPRTSRRTRTHSLDKTDSWSTTNVKINRILWQEKPVQDLAQPEDKTDLLLDIDGPQIYQLCASQLQVLRKLALLKLTAHMEKYCPAHRTGWNWDLPKFLRKMKSPIYKDRNVFGVPLSTIFQRTGKILPAQIEEAMHWLQENAADQVGVFRKSGVKSRIQLLRNTIESNSPIDYSEQQCYDVADMLKLYFRELPEMLLTAKLSETFVLIFQYVPPLLRLESVMCAILLMPEEHSQALQSLLHFLLIIASKSELNHMNENNLAMCLAPTLFHSSCLYKQHFGGSPHPKELAENRAAQECLLFFLKRFHNLFKVPKDFINQCNSSEIKEIKPKLLTDILDGIGGWKEYLKECQRNLMKEVKEKCRGWIPIPSLTAQNSKISIFYKKVADGMPLRLWKVIADVEAPPTEVAHRILRERHIWDYDLVSAKIIAQLDSQTEIFQYIRKTIVPIPNEEYCVIRTWRSDLPRDSCTIVETSVEYPGTEPVPNSTRAIVLASRYLIEPCGSGKSRIIHFSRVDTMGRSPQWYQKNYGYLSAVFLRHLQNSFYQKTNGPESQV